MNTELDFKTLKSDISAALKQWNEPDTGSSPLKSLYLYRQAQLEGLSTSRQITNKLLLDALEMLAHENASDASLLRKRFLDEMTVYAVANAFNFSEATVYRRQNEALRQLTDLLLKSETQARQGHRTNLLNRLEPATYDTLIGVDDYLDQLTNRLTQPGSARIIAIEGIGGLGKTSLADALIRHFIEQNYFDEIGWVSARQQMFNLSGQIEAVELPPALHTEVLVERLLAQLLPHKPEAMPPQEARRMLHHRLQAASHLIVIDNLETVQDVTELLPLLHELSQSGSRFLLTSRQRLAPEPGIFHFPLPPLSQANTLRLVRHEIETHNLTSLQQASDEDLQLIYQAVGGNPLAVRLVLGQTHAFTLTDILTDLAEAHSHSADELYTYIYRRTWDTLDEPTRQLFLAMPLLTADGEGLAELVEVTELTEGVVRTALKRLIDLNLVNSRGDHKQRRYSIHNLTRTFLLQQVLKWQ